MYIDLTKSSKIHQAYLSSLGRALAVAQHLELTTRFVLRIFEGAEKIDSEEAKNLDDLRELTKFIDKMFLGPMAKQFRHFEEITPQEVEILKLGTEARNFIAHESAIMVSEYPEHPDELIRQITLLKDKVTDLVNADNLVSKWSYEIQENKPSPKIFGEGYPLRISTWIFSPIDNIAQTE